MTDDTRRPEDKDETPVDPPTGEGEVGGADWLASQIDAAPTGQFDTRRAPSEGSGEGGLGRAGDSPVLAWWREKLVAADALVNPEPRQAPDPENTETPANSESTKNSESAESTEKAAESESGAPAVDDAEPTLPEPAQFEPRRADKVEADSPSEPEPAFLPEPAFAPEPAWTPSDVDSTGPAFGRQPERELEDEAETGLIPSIEPPLFTPRSARDALVDEPEDGDVPADEATPLPPTQAFPVPAPRPAPDAADQTAEFEPASASNATNAPYETEDLDNFSWKLTANDQLDPRVHRAGTVGEAAAAVPAAAVPPVADSADEPSTRRQARVEADEEPTEPVLPEPADVTAPLSSGPRRRTFTDMDSPRVPPPSTEPARRPLRAARPPAARAPRPVILAAIGVVALLVLGGLFFLGSQLPGLLAAPAATSSSAPAASQTPTTPPEPAAPAAPVGPAALGEQQWTALGGGECLDPYASPWAETFTVVDCAAPHAAQMVFTGSVDEDPAAEYPGEDAILERIYLWCSAPGVLDPAAAGEYSDLQVQGTYPVSAEQWADGQRNYYCFVNRSSGEPLSESVAAPQG